MKKQVKVRLAHIQAGLSRHVIQVAAAVGAAASAGMANAAGTVDVSGVVTQIQGAAEPIATIGSAVLIVLVGIKVYKWVRKAM